MISTIIDSWNDLCSLFRCYPTPGVRESLYCIALDKQDIKLSYRGKEKQAMNWADLKEVAIVTTDEGPFRCDFYWILCGTSSKMVIPKGAIGESQLLQELQQLPNFDNEAVILACTSADNNSFTCWHKPDAKCGNAI